MFRVTDILTQPIKYHVSCLLDLPHRLVSIHHQLLFEEPFQTQLNVKPNKRYNVKEGENNHIFKMDKFISRSNFQYQINKDERRQVQTRQFHTSNQYHTSRVFEIQNPIKLLTNHMNFIRVQQKWDLNLDKEDFLHGSRLAVVTILNQISANNFTGLKGLLSRKELQRLRHEVETVWSDNIRLNAGIEDTDVYLNIINNVRSQQIVHNKYFDIDVTVLAKTSTQSTHMFVIEATFHREYTEGRFPDWIVTRFRLHLKPFKSFIGEDYVIVVL